MDGRGLVRRGERLLYCRCRGMCTAGRDGVETLAAAIFEGTFVDNGLREPYCSKVGRDLRRVGLFVMLDIAAFIMINVEENR